MWLRMDTLLQLRVPQNGELLTVRGGRQLRSLVSAVCRRILRPVRRSVGVVQRSAVSGFTTAHHSPTPLPTLPCRYHKPGLHGFLLSAGWRRGDGLRGPSHPHPIYSLIALESRTAARPSTRAIRVYQCSLPSVCKHASLSKHRTTGGKYPHILVIVILSHSRSMLCISKG